MKLASSGLVSSAALILASRQSPANIKAVVGAKSRMKEGKKE